jgi:hypothetical protein
MLSNRIALGAAIVLCAAVPASAAIKHHRVTHVYPRAIYNMIPGTVRSICPANDGPSCGADCSGPGPCAPPDRA